MLSTTIGLLLNIFIRGLVERKQKQTELKLANLAPYGSFREKDHGKRM